MQAASESTNRQWRIAARPAGDIQESDFTYHEEAAPTVTPGTFLVQTRLLSCDPAMHGWMAGYASYQIPLQPGDVMLAASVGEVVESDHPDFKPGQLVQGYTGWQDYYVSDGKDRTGKRFTVLPSGILPELGLTLLGSSGLTAYFGLFDVGRPIPGDTVVISGAAGAVGSITGQLASIAGCRVIGIAGSNDKCAHLKEAMGFDDCINYREGRPVKLLAGIVPGGVDVFFDNVGGDILEAGLSHIARNGRIVICGAIAGYGQRRGGPANYMQTVLRHATMAGFLVHDYASQYPLAIKRLLAWHQSGQLRSFASIVEGFDAAPRGLIGMFKGENVGKRMIQVR